MQQLIICAFRSLWYNILVNFSPTLAFLSLSLEHSFTFVLRSSVCVFFFFSLSFNFNGEWNMYFYCYSKPLNVIGFYKVNNVNKSMCSRSHIKTPCTFSTILTSPQISPPPPAIKTHENWAKQKPIRLTSLLISLFKYWYEITKFQKKFPPK